jgi:alanine dehydrogenase
VAGLVGLGDEAAQGVNIHKGRIYHSGVASAFGMPRAALSEMVV